MSLGDQLSKMSLAYTGDRDPIAEALKDGKLPTLGEVKRSLKVHRVFDFTHSYSHPSSVNDQDPRDNDITYGGPSERVDSRCFLLLLISLAESRYGNFKLFFNELAPD